VVVDGKQVKIIRRVQLQPPGGPGRTDLPERGNPEQPVIRQVIGDGEATLSFSQDLLRTGETDCTIEFRSRARFQGRAARKGNKATLEGALTAADGRPFTLVATHFLGTRGLAGSIALTSEGSGLEVILDLSEDRTGVGVVRDLRLNRPVYTISLGSNGRGVIRDAEDRVVQQDIALFVK
jgi:hypothetical protein